MAKTNKGKCEGCSVTGIIPKEAAQHCQKCPQIKQKLNVKGGTATEAFVAIVFGDRVATEYWMNVLIPCDTPVYEVEEFLKDIWLECCGHMTTWEGLKNGVGEFKDIYGGNEEPDEKDVAISECVDLGGTVSMDYDMGTTTTVNLMFYEKINVKMDDPGIRVLIRNTINKPNCKECKKPNHPVHYTCDDCDYSKMCEECGDGEHEEHSKTTISNSPRSGSCGYSYDDDEEIPEQYQLS
ncbi:hypothetical protein PPL_08587 [Heterostelium album PN500]|uniref:Uncharacterized protein n=1 Tax=Heterostelium pallidum (strain ATCC 26659 / Pp 5 / PN500) TaxID=670386 RepID=D3BJ62_HETP5|nr:hypothetical protein PPL_08587 [Heterostelium album PN500]EFA77942.1 hypothetical protein PPL_08587 [Heterostelium album PN500]|eukprot:XP_020430070.1 hypothetical protein PPL_08587 [Heterostelium album PN500]